MTSILKGNHHLSFGLLTKPAGKKIIYDYSIYIEMHSDYTFRLQNSDMILTGRSVLLTHNHKM